MPDIDVVDSTWICAPVRVLARLVADPAKWRQWWPELDLTVREWRGDKGVRWTARVGEQRHFAGTMEIWLEPAFDGVVVHYFLQLDPVDGRPLTRRRAARMSNAHRVRAKQVLWAVRDQLDPGRLARVAGPVR